MKSAITQLFKFALAAGLIFWLVETKKITAEPFVQLWQQPWLIPFIFALIFMLLVINNYRWLLLLEGQDIQSSVRQTLPLTFIGLFFNLAMPGSVGGDVIKAYYIAQEQPGTKLRAATSVLMDRIVGLFSMGIIAAVAVLTNWSQILEAPQLKALAVFIFGLLLAFLVFFAVGFSSRIRSHDFTNKILDRLPAGKILTRLYDAIHSFRAGKRQFLIGIVLSIICQSLIILSFYVLTKSLSLGNLGLSAFFFVVPIGLIATAVPISPAGIGVGQAVFFALFNWYQGYSSNLGPTLITIYQVAQAALSIIGAFLYFVRKAPNLSATTVHQ